MDVKKGLWQSIGLSGCLLLAACGAGGDGSSASAVADAGTGSASASCSNPLPVQAVDVEITVNVPQDFDPLFNPAPTTEVFFSVLLPARCPADRFPVVLHSHGYGGSRFTQAAADGTLYPADTGFKSMDEMVPALPYHGYIVISFDERGHGQSQPQNGGGYARMIDPAAETQDARAILDWAFDHADQYAIQTETNSGIAKDIRVGTVGYSYGGAFQLPLAALDARIDAIVPDSTWHSLPNALMPEDAVKQSWLQILGIFAQTPSAGAQVGTINTPMMQSALGVAGIGDPTSFRVRTLDELSARLAMPGIEPEPVSQSDLLALMEAPSMAYFRNQQALGLPWGFGETAAILRPVPALFLQGNRDNLFNVTEAYWNWRYFRDAGGDARLLSMESGHMNPLAAQVEGTNDCGGIVGINTILAWFDHYLKGQDDPEYAAMPTICLSVAPTVGAPTSGSLGLALTDMPVGSQSGTGGVPVTRAQLEATVLASSGDPVFVPITTIRGEGQYLAGIATIGQLTVTTGTPATHPGIAQIGIGIRRGHNLILVDDELAPFVAGSYTENLRVAEGDPILLPAVGEPLQRGDEVGLLFFEQTVQYSAMISPLGVAGLAGGISGLVAGKALPHPITSVLDPKLSIVSNPNPYSVLARDVELPIVIPGTFPGSRLIPVVAQ